ncbi:unnamed protein product [Gulo gulo]|uniref:Uncharacterized protein n=1 Tax=Gulo gulo TaxID=48420 RepID=A0A9X9LT01_GULGU|nr:unnamed protein product [Gulo gulo]
MTLARHPAPLSGAGLRGNNTPPDWPPVAIVPRRGRDSVKLTHPLIGRMRGQPGSVRYACSEAWSRCRGGKKGGDWQARWVQVGAGQRRGPGLVGGQTPRSARTLCGPLVPGMRP